MKALFVKVLSITPFLMMFAFPTLAKANANDCTPAVGRGGMTTQESFRGVTRINFNGRAADMFHFTESTFVPRAAVTLWSFSYCLRDAETGQIVRRGGRSNLPSEDPDAQRWTRDINSWPLW